MLGMLPKADLAAARAWSKLGKQIGRRACHGSAHTVEPERAWLASGWDDFKAVCVALGAAAPAFYEQSGQMRVPDLGRVLDWGSGAGRLTPYLAEASDGLVCVDACPGLVAECAGDVTKVVMSDPANLPSLGMFDTIVSLHVLYSLTPGGMRETIGDLAAVLTPGGRMVLDIPWRPGPPVHADPDPVGLPGGWWVHTFVDIDEAAYDAGIGGENEPPPVGADPTWEDLAPLSLWNFRKWMA